MAGHVSFSTDGKYTVTAGDSTTEFTSLREALDAALPTVATFEKTARLRNVDTGELNGEWRWLPACDVEKHAVNGIRIDVQAIDEMAASLNAKPRPIPIDGGPTPPGMLPSEVHGTALTGGGTLANGYAHWGIVVAGPVDDAASLYLFAELEPTVAREIDAGRMAEGSVHFGYAEKSGDLPRGVELISHALTNDPAVQTLAPANSVKSARRLSMLSASLRSAHRSPNFTRTTRTEKPMKKTTIRKQLHGMALRGPALDKLTSVCASLGIDIDDEMDADSWDSPTIDAISAIKTVAMAEKVTEGIAAADAAAMAKNGMKASTPAGTPDGKPPVAGSPEKPSTPVKAGAKSAASTPDGAVDGSAAVDDVPLPGFASEEDEDAFITAVLPLLRTSLGLADDAAPADVIAALQASADANTGDPAAAQKSRAAGIDILRARVTTLEGELKDLRPLRDEKRARDAEAQVDARAKQLGLTLTAAQRTKLVTLQRTDPKAADAAFGFVNAPPTGTVMRSVTTADAAAAGGADAAERADAISTATSEFEAEVRKAHPEWPAHYVKRNAQHMAAQKYPHLFDASVAAE